MSAAALVRNHTRNLAIAAVLSSAALGWASFLSPSPARVDALLWAFYFPLGAVFWSDFLPKDQALMRNGTKVEPKIPKWAWVLMAVVGIGVLLIGNPISMVVLTAFDLSSSGYDVNAEGHPAINVSPLIAAGVITQCMLFFLGNLGSSREGRTLIQRVLSSPWAHESPATGDWVRLVGTVEDPTPVSVDAKPAAFALVTETETVPGSNPDIVVKRFENEGTFMVRSGQTWVEIDPKNIHWSGPSKHRLSALAPSGRNRVIQTDYLPQGARVLVVGRLRPRQSSVYREVPYALQATDEDPVLVLRTDDPEGLLAMYRMALKLHLLGTVIIAVVAVGMVLVAALGLPTLPDFHFPVGSESE